MGAPDPLPPLRDIIRMHGLTARKSLGQNFLLDLNLTRKIARSAGDLSDATVIEIGPGPGGLTRALLVTGAKKVIAIERDSRCLDALDMVSAAYPGRLAVVAEDALQVDMAALADGPTAIVANLPYNIATKLLVEWLRTDPWPPWWSSMTLMFQREVAERIVATPGGKAYGRLSVLAGWRTEASILFDVPASAFTPPPKVTSSVVHLLPRADPLPCAVTALETVTRAAFGQRRKMLRASLKQIAADPAPLIAEAGLNPTIRAEQISIADFVTLAEVFASPAGPGITGGSID